MNDINRGNKEARGRGNMCELITKRKISVVVKLADVIERN